MYTRNDVILTVDYHLEHLEVRWLNCATGQEQQRNIPTDRRAIERLVAEAQTEAAAGGGKVIWIMESTTGQGVASLSNDRRRMGVGAAHGR